MKTIDLNVYGISEMSQTEMLNVNGGSIFGDIGYAIGHFE
jgi:hypothetical protein